MINNLINLFVTIIGTNPCSGKHWVRGCYQCMPDANGRMPEDCSSSRTVKKGTIKPVLPLFLEMPAQGKQPVAIPSTAVGMTVHTELLPYYDFHQTMQKVLAQEVYLNDLSSEQDHIDEWVQAIKLVLETRKKINIFLCHAQNNEKIIEQNIDFTNYYENCQKTVTTTINPLTTITSSSSIKSTTDETDACLYGGTCKPHQSSTTSSQISSEGESTTHNLLSSETEQTTKNPHESITEPSYVLSSSSEVSSNNQQESESSTSSHGQKTTKTPSESKTESSYVLSSSSTISTTKTYQESSTESNYVSESTTTKEPYKTTTETSFESASSGEEATTKKPKESTTETSYESASSGEESTTKKPKESTTETSYVSHTEEPTGTTFVSSFVSTGSNERSSTYESTTLLPSTSESSSSFVESGSEPCKSASEDMINELDDLNIKLKTIQIKIDETTKVLKECIENKLALTDIITLTSELQTLLSNFNLIVNKIKALQSRGRHIVKARLLGSLRSFPRNIINNDTSKLLFLNRYKVFIVLPSSSFTLLIVKNFN